MQFVDGRDLSTILKKQGKLPTERLLRVFRQTAEGLKAAHDQGVIHRDLKPQNIMLDAADRVYVTDFGLAKSAEQSGMTQTGAVIGTPFYMSPEQVKGEPVGPQSDIFALGVILYQMAAGTVPFGGATPFEVMISRIQRPPKPVRELNPELPVYLQKIIERCLTVDLGLRYQNVQQILDDLDAQSVKTTIVHRTQSQRWLRPAAAGVVLAAVLAAGGLWLYQKGRGAKPTIQKTQSVLVADFANHAGDAVFDGTLEPAFTIALEGASFVSSYNRSAARKVAAQLSPGATGLDETVARLVAVREGINVVTSGSIDKRGDGYEVSVRAIDAATGKTIVADQERASGKEGVLASVARLAAQVRRALGDATPQSTQLAAAETYSAGSLEAAHEYALAQNLQWEGNWDEAIRHYQKALDLDPNLGRAYAGLAAVESNRGRRQDAEKYYKEALARIDRMSDREKYRTRGGYYLLIRNPDNAIEEFSALVKQYPADTAGIANLAAAYFYKRDMPRARQEARRAIDALPEERPAAKQPRPRRDVRGRLRDRDQGAGRGAPPEPEVRPGLRRQGAFAARPGAPGPRRRDLPEGCRGRRAREPPSPPSGWPTSPSFRAARPTRCRSSRRASRRTWQTRTARRRPKSGSPWPTPTSPSRDTAAAVAETERALSEARGENILYPAARVYLATGREPKALALATELAGRLEPDPQAYAELIRGEAELSRGKASEGDQALRGRQEDCRHLGRATRPRKGVPRGGGLHPGGRRTRDVRQAPRRGDRPLPRGIAELPRLPAGLLLPRASPRGSEEPRRGRRLQDISRVPDGRGRPARRRRPKAPRRQIESGGGASAPPPRAGHRLLQLDLRRLLRAPVVQLQDDLVAARSRRDRLRRPVEEVLVVVRVVPERAPPRRAGRRQVERERRPGRLAGAAGGAVVGRLERLRRGQVRDEIAQGILQLPLDRQALAEVARSGVRR